MNHQVIHIIFNPPSPINLKSNKVDTFREAVNEINENSDALFFIIRSEKKIEESLRMLRPDLQIIFWVHLNKGYKDSDKLPHNLRVLKRLRSKIFKANTQIPLITSSALSSLSHQYKGLKKDNDFDPKYRRKLEGEIIYSTTILNKDASERLPEGKFLKELLKHEYNSIPHFRYSNEYDWKIDLLEQEINRSELNAIIGELIGTEKKDYLVDIISPGHSGAYVIHVHCKDQGKGLDFLLKISKDHQELNQEYVNAINNLNSNLPRDIFVGAYPDNNGFKTIYNWHCLKYKFKKGKTTLRSHLTNLCKEKNEDRNIIKNIFKQWEKFENETDFKLSFGQALNPYTKGKFDSHNKEKTIHYKGLTLDRRKWFSIFGTLESLKKWFLSHPSNNCIEEKELISFENFIKSENGLYKDKPIIGTGCEGTPTAIVHGDFHTANILVNQNGKEVCFIDFANMPDKPIRHALSDIGKLSADMEISVLPEQLIVDQPNNFNQWLESHKQWLNEEKISSDLSELQSIYFWNKELLDRAIFRKEELKLSKTETIRQFHMVRLHYFLKALAYQYECREKLVFFLRASIDILEYLTKDKS